MDFSFGLSNVHTTSGFSTPLSDILAVFKYGIVSSIQKQVSLRLF